MKIRSTLLVGAALLSSATLTQASVTDVTYHGDSVLVCPVYTISAADITVVQISGNQMSGGSGQVVGTITTDTASDPTLTMLNSINNDTGFAWTGYIVDVFMNQPFSLAFPSPAVTAPPGWTAAVTIAPFFNGSMYAGQMTFTGGTPVSPISGDPNNILEFGYNLSFSSATSYTFIQQVTPVPEPATGSLAALAALLGLISCRRSRRA